MDRPTVYNLTPEEIFKENVQWLVTNFKYRDGKTKELQPRAAVYSDIWMKTIVRGKEMDGVKEILEEFDQDHQVILDLKEILLVFEDNFLKELSEIVKL